MRLYIGNLSFKASDQDLFVAFSPFGKIVEARVVTELATGRSRGFGFVEFMEQEDAEKAMAELSGRLLLGRVLIIQPAKPKEKQAWEN